MATVARVLHVTTTDISLALLLGPQLRAFAGAGYEVLGASAPGPYVAEIESGGVRHVALRHATRSMAPWQDVLALAELRSVIRRLRPDVVHTHNPKPGVYGRLAARSAGVPAVVNTVHGLYALPEDGWAKRTVVYGLERMAAACSDAELVQNPEDVETLVRIGVRAEKVRLLGNGVDLARFDPATVSPERRSAVRAEVGAGAGDLVCLAVGRLVAEKGYRDIFKAAALLRGLLPNLRVVVAGPADPDKADAITGAEIEQAEASGVCFLGSRADVEDLYGASDFYVLASHREGFPRSAMEAAAMGLPVVATDIRGCRQVVEHEATGLLVPPRDAVALAGAMARMAKDPDLRLRMGGAAHTKARAQFDQERVIDITLDTYGCLLAKRRGSARGC